MTEKRKFDNNDAAKADNDADASGIQNKYLR